MVCSLLLVITLAGIRWNIGKSGDVCNVILGRPAVISRRKNAKNIH